MGLPMVEAGVDLVGGLRTGEYVVYKWDKSSETKPRTNLMLRMVEEPALAVGLVQWKAAELDNWKCEELESCSSNAVVDRCRGSEVLCQLMTGNCLYSHLAHLSLI